MNVPLNNTFSNEALPLNNNNNNIKLETEQDNVAEMMCFFLPHHMTATDTPSEHQVDLVQLKEEPLDVINGDIEKDPLAIEETDIVKSENFKLENEMESEISLNDEVSPQTNFNMKSNELQINDLHTIKTEEEMGFYPGHVTADNGTTTGSPKNCITCKRCVNNSVYDGVIEEQQSSECKCGYGDVIKDYICNFYQKSLNFRSQLKTHVNIHAKEKNYVCNFCKKSFNQKSNLQMHLSVHNKEKTYICNFCQKSFNFRNQLKTHLNIHTKERNYICNFCQKSFNCIKGLKTHLNIYTKEQNYVCNFCQKSFNQKGNLKAHLTIHTKEKKYICNFCQKSFNFRSQLNTHLTYVKNHFIVKTI